MKLSRHRFQIVVLALLAVALGVWASWLIHDVSPYGWLRARLGFLGDDVSGVFAALVTLYLVVGVWMVPTLMLRRFTDLPRVAGEFSRKKLAQLPRDVRVGLAVQRCEREAMLARPAGDPARYRYFQRLGWTGVALGVGSLVVGGILWTTTETLALTLLAVAAVGIIGGTATAASGRPGIFDTVALNRMRQGVGYLSLWVIAITMLMIAGWCVLDALLRG